MKEHVMSKKNYAAGVLSMPATGAIVQSVSQTKGAIGYIGLAYINKEVKPIAVSFDGKNFVKPSVKAAKDKTYPVSRPLYYIYAGASESKVKPFVDYILSTEGQKIVEEVGYVSIK
jgi:phosphate transport system substrate-binding protein